MLKHTLFAALALFLGGAAHAQTQQANPLFQSNDPIAFTIEAPFDTLLRTAARSTDPQPASFTLTNPAAAPVDLQVSPRGLSRRTRDYCGFPPLRLDFQRSAMTGTLMAGQNRLKLVTHCRATDAYEQNVVLEYLAYRLFNTLTPQSYRVRPATVTYRDREGRRSEVTRFGFLIEDVDDMARRNGGRENDTSSGRVPLASLEPRQAARVALFNYMIGNLDWSLIDGPEPDECCHNTRTIARAAGAPLAVVPYDFDNSGFVSAPYAEPPAGVGVAHVRTRLYRGFCTHNGQLPAVVGEFRAQRAAMLALIANETRISQNLRQRATRYIEDFYAILDDPARFERSVVSRCRG